MDRWEANHSDPASAHSAAVPIPAAGYTSVASRVTAAGPITKHSSSATDSTENAVCSRGDPASRADQRARAIGPVCGIVAPPAMPHRNSVQSGACSTTAVPRPATDSVKTRHSAISTRRWPSRSTRRPSCGAHAAPPSDPAADTLPATPYRPVTPEISNTVPRPNMDIGIRPMIPASENCQARGMEKTSAYGARNPGARRARRSAPALAIACLSGRISEQNLNIPWKGTGFPGALFLPRVPRPLWPEHRRLLVGWSPWPAYDAFLLLSFGGPEGPDDVLPFLENVTRGRGIPRQRLEEVAGHYYAAGGVSPINAQCRDMLTAIGPALRTAGLDLPVYWGNRNWTPFVGDTVHQMKADGVRHAVAFATSAYSSYSACRQYLDDLDHAVTAAGPGAPRVDKLRPYFNHPGFIEPFAASAEAALSGLPEAAQAGARLVFTAHSIPAGMARSSGSQEQGTAVPGAPGGRYVAELREASRLIAERVRGGTLPFDLVFQSRSGPTSAPWLEPDVNDHLTALAQGTGTGGAPLPEGPPTAVVAVPVGFVSDHMEVVHDLDNEAAATAAALGLPFARAAAPGATARFAAMAAELVAERALGTPPRALGTLGPRPYPDGGSCPADCCRYAPGRPAAAAGERGQA